MNFFSVFIITFVALASVYAAPVDDLDGVARQPSVALQELKRRIQAAGGCNANVCFAIDGSGSLSQAEFDAEKNFVLDVIALIAVDNPVEVAAVQYATSNSAISPLTANIDRFIRNVQSEPFQRGGTFLTGGISYCFGQLNRRRGEALKMVVLGDGFGNIGSDAVARADLFRNALNAEVCVVGAGVTNDNVLLALTGGKPSNVFEVNSFLDALALEQILEGLVEGICNLNL